MIPPSRRGRFRPAASRKVAEPHRKPEKELTVADLDADDADREEAHDRGTEKRVQTRARES